MKSKINNFSQEQSPQHSYAQIFYRCCKHLIPNIRNPVSSTEISFRLSIKTFYLLEYPPIHIDFSYEAYSPQVGNSNISQYC
jgi:hypothetical protein